jgi:death-on-curing protein
VKGPAWLTTDAVLAMHEQLVAEHGGSSLLRDRGLLESALASPKNHFAYGERDLHVLATVYAKAITRNHPFADGNKRTAFIATYTFLGINGVELRASEEEVVRVVEGLSARSIDPAEFTSWLRGVCVKRRTRNPRRSGKKRRE